MTGIMKIYLDDNLADKALVGLLGKAGHVVVRPAEADLGGKSDALHLEYAIRAGLVVLTSDRGDFADLHQLVQTSGGSHPGIFLVCFDNDQVRDIKPKHFPAAITKLESAGVTLVNQIIVLNQWR
jgi:predicted nuclease of predicted toxin-antitoxin system